MAISKIPSAGFQDNVKFRNILINSDMSIAQRGTSVTGLSNGDSQYLIDRFKFAEAGAPTFEFTMSQDTDVPTGQGFVKSLKMDCTTAQGSLAAADGLRIEQRFEGQNLQYLKKGTSSAESLTLSFWVKSSKTGTYIAEIFDNDNSRQISKAYTIDSANTWEKKTMTYAGDTSGSLDNDNGHSLDIRLWLGAGSNFTSGTLNTSWNSVTAANRVVGQVNLADNTANEWYITGIQLEAGQTASEFEFLPFDVNLQRCLRYYEVIAEGTNQAISSGAIYNSNTFAARVSYSRKRTAPSIDQTDGTDYYKFFDGSTLGFSSFATNLYPTLVATNLVKSPGTVSDNTFGWISTNNASAYIAFDAEL